MERDRAQAGRGATRILAAWLASVEGFADEAERNLAEAVATASAHGLVEVFVRGGPARPPAVRRPLRPARPTFTNAVVARARAATAPVPGRELADPLTDREVEILSYLPSRLTNTELAEQCFVSVNTIKTHMAHIYRKLDAANRNEAIARAREIGLL